MYAHALFPRHLRRSAYLCFLLLVIGVAASACGASGAGTSGPRGTLAGVVVAGPTCPVAAAGHPCPPKAVPGRQVQIETPSGSVVATATTDAQGHFSATLPPGSYIVRVAIIPGQIGMSQPTPGQITVVAGQTATIMIELDTGIR